MKFLRNIDNKWFYKELPWYLKWTLMFIRGDMLVLLPFTLLLSVTSFVSFQFTGVALGVYISVRFLGEMIYWLLQQFGAKKYRPYDYGLKKLDNNAIYIIYQLTSIVWVIVGLLISLFFFLYV